MTTETSRSSMRIDTKAPGRAEAAMRLPLATKDVTRAPDAARLGVYVTDTIHVRAPIAAIVRGASAVVVCNPQGNLAVVKLPYTVALDTTGIRDVMDATQTTVLDITIRKATH